MDNDLLYTDTDSIFYLGNHDFKWFDDEITNMLYDACMYHGLDFRITRPADPSGKLHPMGVLDDEPDADLFRTLGAKKYLERRNGKLYMTVAGINKSAVQCLEDDMYNFRDGFIFDKDHASVHKLEHTYLEDMKPIVWPDGYRSSFKYGINMRPTGYKL